jgi:hypothetical protein
MTPVQTPVAPPTVASHQALAIAEADALPVYKDLRPYRIDVWLGDDGWHVEYHVRRTPERRFLTGGGPHYIIDATTGAILSKKYYQ